MSTTAPSPRELEEQPRTNRWLEYIGEDDANFLAARVLVETPQINAHSPVDLDRVERLMNDLEARSRALAQYAAAHSPQSSRPASNSLAFAAVLLTLWLAVMASFFVYVGLTNGKQSLQHDSLTRRRIISPMPPREERKAGGRFDHLAKTLASSSKKVSQLEAEVERSKKGLQSIVRPVATESPDAATTSITPSDLAIPHKNTDGIIDYWVMPHGPRNSSPVKVFSVGKVASGVVVRNLEDNKYYTVTQVGEWRGIRLPRLAN